MAMEKPPEPRAQDPLLEWQSEIAQNMELDLDGPISDGARRRLLWLATLVLAGWLSVVTLLVIRAF